MKRPRRRVRVAAAIIAALAVAVLGRTLLFGSRQIRVQPAPVIALQADQAAARLSQAIRIRTISHEGPSQPNHAEFLMLHAYLRSAFPRVHAALNREVIGKYSLLYTWSGTRPGSRPTILTAHMDVVPAPVDGASRWSCPPFEGRTADGFIWGRGTLDDKVSVLGILEAVEALLAEGYRPSRTIYLAFGHDEEVGGAGARQLAATLASRGVRAELLLDEGGLIGQGSVPGIAAPVALVGTAEKGYLTLELVAEGEGGHSSMPPPQTATGTLAAAIHALATHPFPSRISGATGQMFQYLGPEMPFPMRALFANQWLFGPAIRQQLAGVPATNAAIRTTLAPTIFRAGERENVLPARARAVVNLRLLPGDSVGAAIEHVRRAIDNPRVEVRVLGEPCEASAVCDLAAPGWRTVEHTIRQVFPDVAIAPFLMVGQTDARQYAAVSDSVLRFLPTRMLSERKDLERLHGVDERVAVANYLEIIRFYAQLMRNCGE